MAQIKALTPEGRLPTAAVGHVGELINNANPGWRNITSLLQDITSVDGFYVRRTKTAVEYAIIGLRVPANGIKLAWGSLPASYIPTAAGTFDLNGSNGSVAKYTVNTGGGGTVTRAFTSAYYWGSGSLPTAAPLPTTHPGTATTWGTIPATPMSPQAVQQATTAVVDAEVADLTAHVDEELAKVGGGLPVRSRIAAMGDSQTDGGDSGVAWPEEESWPSKLGAKLGAGYTVTNAGYSGATVDEMLVRVGAKPMRAIVPAGGIAPSANAVVAPIGEYGIAVTSTRPFATGSLRINIAPDGSWTLYNWTAETIPAGEFVLPTLFPDLQADVVVVWIGGNDRTFSITGLESTVADHVIAGHQELIEWLTPRVKHVMILGMQPRSNEPTGHASHDLVLEVNERLQALYPGKFRSVMAYLQGDVFTDLGTTPTPEDTTAIEQGLLPPSVMSPDGTHISKATATVIGERFVHDYLTGKGWL